MFTINYPVPNKQRMIAVENTNFIEQNIDASSIFAKVKS